ncbi:transporter substrate-binding domain-containing protein [Siccirubricoccus sp. G192]|uniref:transporter substrate-binding domain-containing protein n=1 Tax=Siccirubricoccus sp. G192 TaxID=2849651 RepID=UPI002811FA46|nr:transporter substrate-binding domain-containing protein [Siccirubricoccus sp. G192]
MRTWLLAAALAVAGVAGAAAQTPASQTLAAVKQRGQLICGVSQGFAGFSAPDSRGEFRGLDTDYCRAVAAAVLGDATKVRFVPLTAQARFTALQTGEIDVLFRNPTQTFLRDTSLGLNQGGGEFLRRPGLRSAPRCQCRQGAGTGWRHHLRGAGHHA